MPVTDDVVSTHPIEGEASVSPGRAAARTTPVAKAPDPSAAPATGSSGGALEDTDAHLVRLCLDLQLDALLLTLGAAAAAANTDRDLALGADPAGPEAIDPGTPDPGATDPGPTGRGVAQGPPDGWHDNDGLPWRRWLSEDVDLAVTLAADAQAGHATLPSTLGTDLDHAVTATVVDKLDAHFRSMRALLSDMLAGAPDRGGQWRPRLREALDRCEVRLTQLGEHRLEVTPARGIPAVAGHHYLPGELLG